MIALAWRLERGCMTNRKTRSVEPARRPTGYSWGYSGDGLTTSPAASSTTGSGTPPGIVIYSQFCNDRINNLPDDFTVTYKQLDNWINRHGKLFARNPRAEPFDPYAAGGT
jgi:hypothetical protein